MGIIHYFDYFFRLSLFTPGDSCFTGDRFWSFARIGCDLPVGNGHWAMGIGHWVMGMRQIFICSKTLWISYNLAKAWSGWLLSLRAMPIAY